MQKENNTEFCNLKLFKIKVVNMKKQLLKLILKSVKKILKPGEKINDFLLLLVEAIEILMKRPEKIDDVKEMLNKKIKIVENENF